MDFPSRGTSFLCACLLAKYHATFLYNYKQNEAIPQAVQFSETLFSILVALGFLVYFAWKRSAKSEKLNNRHLSLFQNYLLCIKFSVFTRQDGTIEKETQNSVVNPNCKEGRCGISDHLHPTQPRHTHTHTHTETHTHTHFYISLSQIQSGIEPNTIWLFMDWVHPNSANPYSSTGVFSLRIEFARVRVGRAHLSISQWGEFGSPSDLFDLSRKPKKPSSSWQNWSVDSMLGNFFSAIASVVLYCSILWSPWTHWPLCSLQICDLNR